MAKFQAVSCFSGTGFTTKEAELITTNKQRRRIASILMVLGNAGLVTLIASAAGTMTAHQALWAKLSEFFLPVAVPGYLLPWVNLAIIIVAVYVIYKASTNRRLAAKLTNYLRAKIVKREIFKPVSFEELLLLTGGYGVSKIDVYADSPILNKTLFDSGLRKEDITVLAIVRADETIANPPADTKILLGDELISFGKLENIRKKCTSAG